MRIGGVGLGGVTLPQLLGRSARANTDDAVLQPGFGKAKSVILIALLGGPPQQDTFDCKPNAPVEIRGQFGTISTSAPGIRVGELMPMTARHMDKLAALRAVVTDDNAHSSSGYYMLTGAPHSPTNFENARPGFANRHPNVGGVVRAQQATVRGLPTSIALPNYIFNDGNIPWPGQDAGWLGQKCNPWQINCDPSVKDFRVPDLELPTEVSNDRFGGRTALKQEIEQQFAAIDRGQAPSRFDEQSQLAFGLLSSSSARQAFDIAAEPDAVRDRYGRSKFGQSLLLARRLVEAGVRLVQVNWTRIDGIPTNRSTWDTHSAHHEAMKEVLMPIMDRAYSALLEELSQRGLLDETLVIWMGEFGRTPRVNGVGGRDHWGRCFSVALGGAGIKGGHVHGESDKDAAYPVSGIVRPEDLTATLFNSLGIPPHAELKDALGRPTPASRGRVLSDLY